MLKLQDKVKKGRDREEELRTLVQETEQAGEAKLLAERAIVDSKVEAWEKERTELDTQLEQQHTNEMKQHQDELFKEKEHHNAEIKWTQNFYFD